MRIELIQPNEMGPVEDVTWRRLQASERTVATPGLSPEWARIVGDVREDARIAVMQDGAGRVQGYLPVQAGKARAVEPLANSLNLGCGLVGDPNLEWGAAEWLRDLKARAFIFEGAPERQVEFSRAARGSVIRMSAELHGGGGAYLLRKREEDIDVLERRGARIERLENHAGAVRVKHFACEGPDFDQAMYWSAGAYRNPQHDWEMAALRTAFEREDDAFQGALFTLNINDELAAGAFFLMGHRTAQLVFYGEKPELETYNPAGVLIADAIAAFASRGLDEVDLGAVEGPLTREFATRRRQRLYGLIRPAEKKRFQAPFAGLGRSASKTWTELGVRA